VSWGSPVEDRRRQVVPSPDGREFELEALPAGLITLDVQHPLGWLLGWLWHFTFGRRRWSVEIRERTVPLGWLEWRVKPWWSTGKLGGKAATLDELDRLGRAIEAWDWPGLHSSDDGPGVDGLKKE